MDGILQNKKVEEVNIWKDINWKNLSWHDVTDINKEGYWWGFGDNCVRQYDSEDNEICVIRLKQWKQ